MNNLLQFLKTTFIGGLLVVTPIFLMVMIITETLETLAIFVDPVAELLPVTSLAGFDVTILLALLVLVGICFISGLVALTGVGSGLGRGIERKLNQLPGYKLAKAYTLGMAGSPKAKNFQVVLLSMPSDSRAFALLIEEGETHAVVFIPSAPSTMSGSVQYVPRERVTKLDTSLARLSDVIARYGIGATPLFESIDCSPSSNRSGHC